jgi:hypothetical protein
MQPLTATPTSLRNFQGIRHGASILCYNAIQNTLRAITSFHCVVSKQTTKIRFDLNLTLHTPL